MPNIRESLKKCLHLGDHIKIQTCPDLFRLTVSVQIHVYKMYPETLGKKKKIKSGSCLVQKLNLSMFTATKRDNFETVVLYLSPD